MFSWYDLRAVLVHDGFYGRSHIYSYVRQHDKWWKVVDYSVTEVSALFLRQIDQDADQFDT